MIAYTRGVLSLAFVLAACVETGAEEHAGGAEQAARLSFTDVTTEAGLGAFRHSTGARGDMWFPETMGAGGGFIDYDGDGRLDILLVGGGSWDETEQVKALWLYRNDGDGTFTDVTEAAGLGGLQAYGMGITCADYDNDGDEDFYFTTLYENLLFRNDGGRFRNVAGAVGVAGDPAWSTAALFFDADLDGHLDLYVGGYVQWSPEDDLPCPRATGEKAYCTPEIYAGVPGRFYRNKGDGTFTDRTREAGFLPAPGKTLGVAELDYNLDGYPDLVVANDTEPDLLYENNGDETFREKGVLSGIAFDEHGKARAGMGVDVGDVDNSGQPTIFIGNFSNEMISVYHYRGGSAFTDRAAASRIGLPSLRTLTFGLFLFDADLDGKLDLFAANGHIQPDMEEARDGQTYRQAPHLFINRGGGRFEDVVPGRQDALAVPVAARGAAYADYDRDGDLDVLLTENGGPVRLLRNDLRTRGSTGPPHYLRVQVESRGHNRNALGTRVVALMDDERQERRIRSGASYLSSSERAATFGLGLAEQVDTLLIYWPNGQVDRFTNVAPDQEMHVVRE